MMTTKQVAESVGLSVRIIQEYEKAGLAFKPTHRTNRGYLLYDDREINRLWQIRFYRELGYENKQIYEIFNDPTFDFHSSITKQIEELKQKKLALDRLIETAEFIADSGITPLSVQKTFAPTLPVTYDFASALLNAAAKVETVSFGDFDVPPMVISLVGSVMNMIDQVYELAKQGEPPESIQIQMLIEAIVTRAIRSSTIFRWIVLQFAPGTSAARRIEEGIGSGAASYGYTACMVYLNNHPEQEFDKRLVTIFSRFSNVILLGETPDSIAADVLAAQLIHLFRQELLIGFVPLRPMVQTIIDGFRNIAQMLPDESDFFRYIADALQHYMDITPADVLDQCGASPQTATESEGISDSSSQSSESELDRQLRLALQRLNPNPAFVDEAFKMEPTQRGRADLLAHLRSMDSQNNQSLKNNRKDGSP